MAITNYAELKASIADWLNRDDLVAVIPSFIALAEARHNRDMRLRQMVKRATSVLDDKYLTLPSDWLEARNIQIATGFGPKKLEYVTHERADEINRKRAGAGGVPEYYTITGNQLELVPSPPVGTEIEMTYYARIPALTDAAPTNFLLTGFPDVYLYGALAHTAPYLKDDPRLATWGQLYDRALEEIIVADERSQYSGSVLKMRTSRKY